MAVFKNRRDAGRQLAEKLHAYRGTDAIVVALPRGGVVVAQEIACDLALPLDIVVTRKIAHPLSSEYAIGAVDEHGETVFNETEAASVDKEWLDKEIIEQVREAHRRSRLYRKGIRPLDLAGRIAIVVDDGIATGYTMELALRTVKKFWPRKVVVAVPVAPPEVAAKLKGEVDQLVLLDDPNLFLGSIGSHYDEFEQVSDDEVVELLHSSSLLGAISPPSGE